MKMQYAVRFLLYLILQLGKIKQYKVVGGWRLHQDINKSYYPDVLELGYIEVLEASAERIKGSTPFVRTKRKIRCNIF